MSKILKIISDVTNPIITFSIFSLLFSLLYLEVDYFHFTIQIILILILGSLAVYTSKTTDKYDSYKFDNRKARLGRAVILFSSLVYSIFLIILSMYYDNFLGSLVFTIYIVLNVFFLLFSYLLNFKFSAHIAFNGLILIVIPSPLKFLLLAILILVVGYARISLHKHNTRQVVITSLLLISIFITYEIFTNVFS